MHVEDVPIRHLDEPSVFIIHTMADRAPFSSFHHFLRAS